MIPRILITLLMICASCFPTSALAGKVYQWRDANGKLHISDRPPAVNPGEAAPQGKTPQVTAPETTLRTVEPASGGSETHRSPINRQRLDRSIEQYQKTRPSQ